MKIHFGRSNKGARIRESMPQRRTFLPATTFACLYAVLLLCIPTRLIVGPIGAPGTPASLFAMAGLLWWTCAAIGGLSNRSGLSPTRIGVGLFAATALASYAAGHIQGWYQPADIHQVSDRRWEPANVAQVTETIASAADRGLLSVAGWVGIVLMTAEGVRSWRDMDRVIKWIVRAATFVAALGVTQYTTGLNLAGYLSIPGLTPLADFGFALSRSDLNRIVSTSAHPIELGVTMSAILPLALHRSLHSSKRSAWIPTLLIGLASLMSVSRSAVVVAAVGLLVLFVSWPWRWRLGALALAPVAAVVGPIALPGLLGTLRALFTNFEHDPSIAGRTADYELTFGLIWEQPLLGRGVSTFVPMVYRTLDNEVLGLLLQIGIIGTTIFLALIAAGLWQAWAPKRMGGSSEQGHLGVAISASLIGIFASYLTFDALGFRQVAGLTFLFVGLAGAMWHLARDSQLAAISGEQGLDQSEIPPAPAHFRSS